MNEKHEQVERVIIQTNKQEYVIENIIDIKLSYFSGLGDQYPDIGNINLDITVKGQKLNLP